MPTPFAALETRLNTVGNAKFANATASVNGAPAVDVVFDNNYDEALGMDGAAPRFGCAAAVVAGIAQGAAVTIVGTAGTVDYVVRGVEPDGAGWVRVLLELA